MRSSSLDPQGHVVDWNAAAQHVTGWTEDEILHRPFAVFFPDEALALGDPDSHLRIAAAEGKFLERAQRQRKEGSRFWAAVEMTALYDAEGEVRGYAKVLRDINATVRSRIEVDESRACLAAIVDSAMDAIILIDAERTIVVFNNAAENMFRYAQGDVVGHKLDLLIPEGFRRDHGRYIRAFNSPGLPSRAMGPSGALSARRAGGEEFPIEALIFQVSLDGKKYFSAILRDITERKRAEVRQAPRKCPFRRPAPTIVCVSPCPNA
jgi:two-component system sensor kinase FixL